MREEVMQTLMGMIGTIGFSVIFNVRGRKMVVTTVGAALSWAAYSAAFAVSQDRIIGFFFATLTVGTLAEVLARIIKTPVIVLLVPMLIPLFPGSDLFYTTRYLVQGDVDMFGFYLNLVIREAGAMAFGIILVTSIVQVIMKIYNHVMKIKNEKRLKML